MADAREAIEVIHARFGRHRRTRALHAKGTWARGTFTATPQARELCRAAHLDGSEINVLARLSNGAGDPGIPDYAPDVRGLAMRFEPAGGEPTDLVSQSAPRFFSATPDDFLDFIRANTGRFAPLKLPLFLATHPKALPHLRANAAALRPIPSFANCRFYGVHAFRWLDATGAERYVRCDWRPLEGERRIGSREARGHGRDYLGEDLAHRLTGGSVDFVLEVQIAAEGDSVDDPSAHWPSERRRLDAGTLRLTEVIDDPEAGGEIVVFDPMRLADGVEPSADPVLGFRPRAYSESAALRAETS